jgi:hypothetical protein
VSWDKRFAEPIVLEDSSKLATLRDAIAHLAQLIPEAKRNMPEILTASDLLTSAAEHGAQLSSPASLPCRRSIGTRGACSIPRAKTPNGDAES